jgi:hypothetical protein
VESPDGLLDSPGELSHFNSFHALRFAECAIPVVALTDGQLAFYGRLKTQPGMSLMSFLQRDERFRLNQCSIRKAFAGWLASKHVKVVNRPRHSIYTWLAGLSNGVRVSVNVPAAAVLARLPFRHQERDRGRCHCARTTPPSNGVIAQVCCRFDRV